MTVPANDSMPCKTTQRQDMPMAWTRDYTDTIQRALGAITIDRQVDISSALRWAFRSQTTYEVHPHVHRFPTTPTAVSTPPALTEAEPVSNTIPTTKASAQPLQDASLLLEDSRLEDSSLEDSSLSDAPADDSSLEGSSLEQCSVEDAALEDASHEQWPGLEVHSPSIRPSIMESCGVETQPSLQTPTRALSDLEEGASATPLRATTGPPPPECSEVEADGGDRGPPEAAAVALRRSVAWASDVRSRSTSTTCSTEPAGAPCSAARPACRAVPCLHVRCCVRFLHLKHACAPALCTDVAAPGSLPSATSASRQSTVASSSSPRMAPPEGAACSLSRG